MIGGQDQLLVLWTYESLIGPWPGRMEPHHTCENRWCVNPWHIEPLTKTEHARLHGGSAERAKTHCPKGHPYNGSNLMVERNGNRRCRTCKNERRRKKSNFAT